MEWDRYPDSTSRVALQMLEAENAEGDPLPPRPRQRADCVDGPRPCPWIGCRYHLRCFVTRAGTLYVARDLLADGPTCALDVASSPMTLAVIASLLGLTTERVRQLEAEALRAFRKHYAE